jgi:hypothetical protein
VPDLALDDAASRVRLHTFAEGLFARLAHDLALACTGLRGTAVRAPGEAVSGQADLEVPLSGIVVLGVLAGGRVDESGLSPADRREALAKMRREVFHADEGAVLRVRATLTDGGASVVLVPPNGREVALAVRPTIRETPAGLRVTCVLDVSLTAIGSDPVKGPMGAFKVKDRVEVHADLVWSRQPA